jgi:hypothetical protein
MGAPIGPRRRVARGVFDDRYGPVGFVQIGPWRRNKRFPKGTLLRDVQACQDAERVQLRKLPPDAAGTLEQDLPRYLKAVGQDLVSLADRARHLEGLVAEFGSRRTLALQHHLPALNAHLHRLRETKSAST